jgi:hypothetical protein
MNWIISLRDAPYSLPRRRPRPCERHLPDTVVRGPALRRRRGDRRNLRQFIMNPQRSTQSLAYVLTKQQPLPR